MDWTALFIGAIPSIVSLVTLLIQVMRDKKKDQATAKKTRAEAAQEMALGEKTRIEATEKIVGMYEGIIDKLEERIKVLEAKLKMNELHPPKEPDVSPILKENGIPDE